MENVIQESATVTEVDDQDDYEEQEEIQPGLVRYEYEGVAGYPDVPAPNLKNIAMDRARYLIERAALKKKKKKKKKKKGKDKQPLLIGYDYKIFAVNM